MTQMSAKESVLVTGGAGYIGSHACKALAKDGFLPIALDSLVSGRREHVKWGPLVVGDIADESLVQSLVERYALRSAIHFAAFAEVEQSMENPEQYYDNNIAKSVRFIRALRRSNLDILVFSSSCAVYGVPTQLPVQEEMLARPVSPYGESKLTVERILQAYERAYGFRSVSLRYFNAAGADEDNEIGENPQRSRLIPRAVEAAAGRTSELVIYGSDYPTRDGTAVRDYVHVQDIVDAHLGALAYLHAGGRTTACNLGTGTGYSVKEILQAVEAIAGNEIPKKLAPRRPGDPPELIADPRRANHLFGWRPTRSDLDTMLRSAWNWHAKATLKK